MAITTATRKTLWALSGNQCAICGKELIRKQYGAMTISGEECHIVSQKEKGPRHRSMKDYDAISNLILLCQEHHKMIDENPDRFTEALLQDLKKNHESKINDLKDTSKGGLMLSRADHVRDLIRCLAGAEQYATDYPVDREEDYPLFARFLDLVNNFDVIDDNCDEFVKIDLLGPTFKELTEKGYVVLYGMDQSFGHYKLRTAFVFIKKKEDIDK